jgi:hypothetical protein
MSEKETSYIAKIKVEKQTWSGRKREQAEPQVYIYGRPNATNIFLLNDEIGCYFNGDENEQGEEEFIQYIRKEGYRIFVYNKDEVIFKPTYAITPISGKDFPSDNFLQLKNVHLKVGESMKVSKSVIDAAFFYTITILDIYEE